MSVMFCLWSVSRVAWSSSVCVGSLGREAAISWVMLVKGRGFCMSVTRPPPPPRVLSCLSVVYPVNFGEYDRVVSFVSWIRAMCMLCLVRVCLSSCILLVIPSILSCRMFRVLMVFVDGVRVCVVGGLEGGLVCAGGVVFVAWVCVVGGLV